MASERAIVASRLGTRRCNQVGLEISGRRWASGFPGSPSHFQGDTFNPQLFISPAGLWRNFLPRCHTPDSAESGEAP